MSIGVGVGGKNLAQTEAYADAALDLAPGRGGDQAVVKLQPQGRILRRQAADRRKEQQGKIQNRRSRAQTADRPVQKIFIMGHANRIWTASVRRWALPDSACYAKKEPYLVIDEVNESLQEIFKQAKESDDYQIISSEKALSLAEEESLLSS